MHFLHLPYPVCKNTLSIVEYILEPGGCFSQHRGPIQKVLLKENSMPIKFFNNIFNHNAPSVPAVEEARHRSNISDAAPNLPELNLDSMPALNMDDQGERHYSLAASSQENISASPTTHEIELIQIIRSPGTKSASTVDTARQAAQGAVFNQDGTLNHANLERFVAGLIEQLPPLPANAHPRLTQRREQLIRQLTHIPVPVAEGAPADAGQLLEIRDKFAAAANDARKLAQHFLGHRFPRHPDKQAALLYSCLAANLVELKRLHLTAAAPAATDSYVQRERANLEKRIPTLAY